jgi:hypothetical protein
MQGCKLRPWQIYHLPLSQAALLVAMINVIERNTVKHRRLKQMLMESRQVCPCCHNSLQLQLK